MHEVVGSEWQRTRAAAGREQGHPAWHSRPNPQDSADAKQGDMAADNSDTGLLRVVDMLVGTPHWK
jgi:hypothetical protein